MELKKSPKYNYLKNEKRYANNIFYEKIEFTAFTSQMIFSQFSKYSLKGFLKIGHL